MKKLLLCAVLLLASLLVPVVKSQQVSIVKTFTTITRSYCNPAISQCPDYLQSVSSSQALATLGVSIVASPQLVSVAQTSAAPLPMTLTTFAWTATQTNQQGIATQTTTFQVTFTPLVQASVSVPSTHSFSTSFTNALGTLITTTYWTTLKSSLAGAAQTASTPGLSSSTVVFTNAQGSRITTVAEGTPSSPTFSTRVTSALVPVTSTPIDSPGKTFTTMFQSTVEQSGNPPVSVPTALTPTGSNAMSSSVISGLRATSLSTLFPSTLRTTNAQGQIATTVAQSTSPLSPNPTSVILAGLSSSVTNTLNGSPTSGGLQATVPSASSPLASGATNTQGSVIIQVPSASLSGPSALTSSQGIGVPSFSQSVSQVSRSSTAFNNSQVSIITSTSQLAPVLLTSSNSLVSTRSASISSYTSTFIDSSGHTTSVVSTSLAPPVIVSNGAPSLSLERISFTTSVPNSIGIMVTSVVFGSLTHTLSSNPNVLLGTGTMSGTPPPTFTLLASEPMSQSMVNSSVSTGAGTLSWSPSLISTSGFTASLLFGNVTQMSSSLNGSTNPDFAVFPISLTTTNSLGQTSGISAVTVPILPGFSSQSLQVTTLTITTAGLSGQTVTTTMTGNIPPSGIATPCFPFPACVVGLPKATVASGLASPSMTLSNGQATITRASSSTSSSNGWPIIIGGGIPAITAPPTRTISSAGKMFSTERSTNPSWRTNTWMSTTVNGKPTIVPVIVGCKDCGGLGGGIIYWNVDWPSLGFPDIENPDLDLPRPPLPVVLWLPGLPKISFPCIQFLWMKVGDCPAPDTVVDSPPPPPPPGDNGDENKDDKSTSKEDKSSSTSKEDKSSSTSTSSCEEITVTSCSVFVTVSIGTINRRANSPTMTTTTITSKTCDTLTACSATGRTTTKATTTSASPTPTLTQKYLIPNPDKPVQVINDFTNRLKQETDPESLYFVKGDLPGDRVLFWRQNLDSDQAQIYAKDPAVLNVFDDLGSSSFFNTWQLDGANFDDMNTTQQFQRFPFSKRDDEDLVDQKSTPAAPLEGHLKCVSGPENFPFWCLNSYTYRKADSTVWVYVVDTGADTTNDAFSTQQIKSWIWAGRPGRENAEISPYDYETTRDDADVDGGHGTCMASLVDSLPFGVTKNGNLRIVRLPRVKATAKQLLENPNFKPPLRTPNEAIIDGLQKVLAEVRQLGIQKKAVVLMAVGSEASRVGLNELGWPIATVPGTNKFGNADTPLYFSIRNLVAEGVVFVGPGGNGGQLNQQKLADAPAVWTSSLGILSVGGTSTSGVATPDTRYKPDALWPGVSLNAWAPGTYVVCAKGKANGLQFSTGTSPASAIVAGLASYYLGRKEHRDKIIALESEFKAGSDPIKKDLAWGFAMAEYVKQMSSIKDKSVVTGPGEELVPMIWNGEYPLNTANVRLCPGGSPGLPPGPPRIMMPPPRPGTNSDPSSPDSRPPPFGPSDSSSSSDGGAQLPSPSSEGGVPVDPSDSSSDGGAPVDPSDSSSDGGAPVDPSDSSSDGGAPVDPSDSSSDGGAPLELSSTSDSSSDGGVPFGRPPRKRAPDACGVCAPLQYKVMVPHRDVPRSTIDAFTDRLRRETDARTLVVCGGNIPESDVLFWKQALTTSQVELYAKDPAVAHIFDTLGIVKADAFVKQPQPKQSKRDLSMLSLIGNYDGHNYTLTSDISINKRATGDLVHQRGAFITMKTISQPEDVRFDCIDSYTFREEEPDTVRIYIIDSGANPQHDSYKALDHEPDWLFAGSMQDGLDPDYPYDWSTNKEDVDPLGHGTCMLSIAVSEKYGISKKARVTIVKLPSVKPSVQQQAAGITSIPFSFATSVIGDAYQQILTDVVQKNLAGRAVILAAVNGDAQPDVDQNGLPNPTNPDAPEFWAISGLMKQRVVLVTSTGNYGKEKQNKLDSEPAVWSDALGIVSVGATYSDGVVTDYTQFKTIAPWKKSKVVAWAVGEDYICASHTSVSGSRDSVGTSPAAAAVAGLIAYYLGRPEHRNSITSIAQNMGGLDKWNFAVQKYVGTMSKLKDKTTPKSVVVKPMVWNGEYPVNDKGIQFCAKTSPGSPEQSGQPGASGSGGSGRPSKRGDGDSCPICYNTKTSSTSTSMTSTSSSAASKTISPDPSAVAASLKSAISSLASKQSVSNAQGIRSSQIGAIASIVASISSQNAQVGAITNIAGCVSQGLVNNRAAPGPTPNPDPSQLQQQAEPPAQLQNQPQCLPIHAILQE